jgi:ABC-type microcin C transport system duplicated ATPase subunit YejF
MAKFEAALFRFEGENPLQSDPQKLEKVHGGRIAIIFQEPAIALQRPALQAV